MKHVNWKYAVWLLLYLAMISTIVLVLMQYDRVSRLPGEIPSVSRSGGNGSRQHASKLREKDRSSVACPRQKRLR